VTARGAFKLLAGSSPAVPAKSTRRRPPTTSRRTQIRDPSSIASANTRTPGASPATAAATAAAASSWIPAITAVTSSVPYSAHRSCSSRAPAWFAAICASRSAMFSAGRRAGYVPEDSTASTAPLSKTPPWTAGSARNTTPSSSRLRANGGIDPGIVPPTSA
jgi:hypothetical protein